MPDAGEFFVRILENVDPLGKTQGGSGSFCKFRLFRNFRAALYIRKCVITMERMRNIGSRESKNRLIKRRVYEKEKLVLVASAESVEEERGSAREAEKDV